MMIKNFLENRENKIKKLHASSFKRSVTKAREMVRLVKGLSSMKT